MQGSKTRIEIPTTNQSFRPDVLSHGHRSLRLSADSISCVIDVNEDRARAW
jgi:hypothetical protein